MAQILLDEPHSIANVSKEYCIYLLYSVYSSRGNDPPTIFHRQTQQRMRRRSSRRSVSHRRTCWRVNMFIGWLRISFSGMYYSTLVIHTHTHQNRLIICTFCRSGYNGTACLLKTICNTAESDLFENNGIFGNLFHIVFTPTTSRDERIPQFFYDAEQMGRRGACEHFSATCPTSLLEYVSGVWEWFE